jgi:high-affinity iron transporter
MAVRLMRSFLWLFLLAFAGAGQASTPAQQVQTSWRLLDYIAVDYREAVAAGRIKNQLEYDEMVEFSSTVSSNLAILPPKPQRAKLLADAATLQEMIRTKAEPARVAAQAKAVAGALLAAYPVPLAPTSMPDIARGAALYAQNCASCHGAKGEGPPPEFASLTRRRSPSPTGRALATAACSASIK